MPANFGIVLHDHVVISEIGTRKLQVDGLFLDGRLLTEF